MRTDCCSDGVLEPTGPAIASVVSASGEGSVSRGATSLRLPLERGRGIFPALPLWTEWNTLLKTLRSLAVGNNYQWLDYAATTTYIWVYLLVNHLN